MPFGISDLSFDISASSKDAEKSINEVQDGLNEVVGSAVAAGEAVDEYADEASEASVDSLKLAAGAGRAEEAVDEVGDSAMSSSVRLGAFTTSMNGAALASAAASTAMTVSLIPSILSLAAILGPLVVTAGALATALGGIGIAAGAIVFSGLIAQGGELEDTLESVQKELKGIISEFGQQFVPLIDDAIKALPVLLRRVLDSINGLDQFTNALRDLGGFAMDAIPAVVDVMTQIGVEALPELRKMASFITSKMGPTFRFLKGVVKETYPEFKNFTLAMLAVMPPFIKFGVTVTNVVVPALTALVLGIREVLQFVNSLPTGIKEIVTALTVLAPIIFGVTAKVAGLSAALGGFSTALGLLTGPIGWVITAIAALGVAWSKNLFGIQTKTKEVFTAVVSEIRSFVDWLEGRWAVFTQSLKDHWDLFGAGILSGTQRFMTRIEQVFSAGSSVLVEIWEGDTDAMLKMWDIMVMRLEQAALTGMETLRDAVVYGLTTIIMAFDDTFDQFPTTAALALQDVANVVLSGTNSILEDLLGFRSDSKESWDVTMAAWKNLTQAHIPKIRSSIKRMLNGAKQDVTGFKKRITTVWMGIWPLLPTPVQKASKTILKAWRKLSRTVGRLTGSAKKKLLDAWTAIKPPLKKLAKRLGYVNDQGQLTKQAFIDVGLAITSLVTGPIGTILTVIAKLAQVWNSNLLGIRDITLRIFSKVKSFLTTTVNTIRQTVKSGIRTIRTFWTQNVRPLIKTTRRTFGEVKRIVTNVVNGIYREVIQPILNSIKQHWKTHGDEITREVMILWNNIKGTVKTTLSIIKTAVTAAFNVIKGVVKTVMPIVKAIIKTHIKIIKTIFSAAVDTLMFLWDHFGDEIMAVTRFVFDVIGSVINTAIDAILTTIRVALNLINGDWEGAWNAIAGFLERLLSGLANFVGKWTSGLWDEITSTISDIGGWIKRKGSSLFDSAFGALADAGIAAYNAIMPDRIGVPEVTVPRVEFSVPGLTIAGHEVYSGQSVGVGPFGPFGGQSFGIPQLDTGGFIRDTGLALVHKGERVIKAANVARDGGIGGGVTIGDIYIDARGADDPDEVGTAVSDEMRSFLDF